MKIVSKPRGGRPAQHLADVVRAHGTSTDAAWISQIILKGFVNREEQRKAQRLAERGDDLKRNPYVTDAGKCERKVVYSLMNVPETEATSTDSLLNFAIGHEIEDLVADLFVAANFKVQREVRIEIPTANTKASGRIDFLIVVEGEGKRFLVELKSTNYRAMGKMLRDGQEGKDDHRRQLNLYLHATQLGLVPGVEEPLTEGYLVYIVTGAVMGEPVSHAYKVEYNEELATSDLAVMDRAKQAADAKVVPRIPSGFSRSSYPCLYCSYRSGCWGN